jgi:hypothetical protein
MTFQRTRSSTTSSGSPARPDARSFRTLSPRRSRFSTGEYFGRGTRTESDKLRSLVGLVGALFGEYQSSSALPLLTRRRLNPLHVPRGRHVVLRLCALLARRQDYQVPTDVRLGGFRLCVRHLYLRSGSESRRNPR